MPIGDRCAWLKSGWTGVPNYFLDKLSTLLPPSHFCVLLHLWRKTYGDEEQRNRAWGSIRISQTGLAHNCNVSPRVVFEALTWLREARLLKIQSNGFRRVSTIEVAFDFDLEQTSIAIKAIVEKAVEKRQSAALDANRRRGASRAKSELSLAAGANQRSLLLRTSSKENFKQKGEESAGSRPAPPVPVDWNAKFKGRIRELAKEKSFG